MRIIGIMLVLVAMMGCAPFQVNDPITGNNLIKTGGAPLLSRNDAFEVERTWLDEANNLTTFRVKRLTDERADAQIEAMKIMAEALRAGAATSILP